MIKIIKKISWDLPKDHSAPFDVYSYGLNEIMRPGMVKYGTGENDWLFIFFNDEVFVELKKGFIKKLNSDSFVIWAPEDYHHYGNEEIPWRHSWIHVAGTEVCNILNRCGFKRLSPVQIEGAQIIVENYFLQIFNEVSSYKNPNKVILRNLFECWLLEMARLTDKNVITQANESIKRLKRYIDMNFTEKISLAQMSNIAAFSIPHMCFEFKKYFGVSPGKYLIEQRIDLARYLLRNRALRISEIAASVGYTDIYQFSKSFKKVVGISPQKFRNSF